MHLLKTVYALARTYCYDRSIPSLHAICRNYLVYFYDDAVAMVIVKRYIMENCVNYGLKQGQITLNIET